MSRDEINVRMILTLKGRIKNDETFDLNDCKYDVPKGGLINEINDVGSERLAIATIAYIMENDDVSVVADYSRTHIGEHYIAIQDEYTVISAGRSSKTLLDAMLNMLEGYI